jgi:5-methyltetrahydrofolate--homocysteine methyltransferase
MAAEVEPFCQQGLVNALGGCCGSRPEHIAAIVKMASAYPPRNKHDVEPLMRLSGLEPLIYRPDPQDQRSNVAGSMIYKKAIVDGDYDKAQGIALKQVCHLGTLQ